MDRRTVLALTGAALAAPHGLFAQPAKHVFRIATLDDAVENARAQSWQGFRKRLGELGLVEGKDVVYEARYARGDTERLPASAAMKATSSIPIVFIGTGDPVGSGLVTSQSRPGGNATGTSILATETTAKSLEVLHEMLPGAKRLAFLGAQNETSVATFRQVEQGARAMNVTIRRLDGRKRSELEKSFETAEREKVQGIVVSTQALLLEHRDQIVRFAAREKIPDSVRLRVDEVIE